MTKSIMVFIKGKWIVKPFSSASKAWAWGGWAPKDKFEKFVSREDTLALKVAREIAEECELKLEVRDLASLRGWISARINRVKNTPTIIVNNQRIEGVPSKDKLLGTIEKIKKNDCE